MCKGLNRNGSKPPNRSLFRYITNKKKKKRKEKLTSDSFRRASGLHFSHLENHNQFLARPLREHISLAGGTPRSQFLAKRKRIKRNCQKSFRTSARKSPHLGGPIVLLQPPDLLLLKARNILNLFFHLFSQITSIQNASGNRNKKRVYISYINTNACVV